MIVKEPKNPTKDEPAQPNKETTQERPSKEQRDEGQPKNN
jgi:hypothetical protein